MNEERKKLKEIFKILIKDHSYNSILSKIIRAQSGTYKICQDLIIKNTQYISNSRKFSERIYHILNDLFEIPRCSTCQITQLEFRTLGLGYRIFCSPTCSTSSNKTQQKLKETYKKNLGVDHPMKSQKVKNDMKQRSRIKHGTDYPQQSQKVKEQTRQNNQIKYGADYPNQIPENYEQTIQTNLEKWGYKSTTQHPDVRKKQIKTSRKKEFQRLLESDRLKQHYIPYFKLEDFNGVKHNKYNWECLKCNTIFEYGIYNGRIPRCPTCYPYTKSNGERQILEYCKSLNLEIIENNKSILNPYELDIYIPTNQIAIEYNGNYWHSELQGKTRYYHQNKTIECLKKNITLVQIFEDEWIDKQNIVKSILLNKFSKIENRIFARKCKIYSIKKEYARQFLDDNHIQGNINGDHYGLSYNNELVSLITIGKSRFDKKYDLEIYRFCGKLNTVIVGGLGKLIKHIQRTYPNQTIMTYADLRYGTGSGYKKVGFSPINITQPGYFYVKGINRYSRIFFQKHKLKSILESFDPKLTEWQNMQLNGYDRIWDCGNVVYKMG